MFVSNLLFVGQIKSVTVENGGLLCCKEYFHYLEKKNGGVKKFAASLFFLKIKKKKGKRGCSFIRKTCKIIYGGSKYRPLS